MKTYTDLEQSKKLAEILPIESADMCYKCIGEDPYDTVLRPYYEWREEYKGLLVGKEVEVIPCWSLAALLNAVDFNTINLHYDNARIDWVASATIHDSTKHCTKYESTRALNPVDACYGVIMKLHEEELL